MNVIVSYLRLIVVAIQFLTRIPLFPNMKVTEEELGRCLAFFPLVGLMIAMIMSFIVSLAIEFTPFSNFLIAALLLLVETAITGAFHWDGLADTFDGFFSTHKSREEMLEIMHDSRIGVMGTISIVMIALVQLAALSGLLSLSFRDIVFILSSVYMLSKWGCVFISVTSAYGRKKGKGLVFLEHSRWQALAIATMSMIPLMIVDPRFFVLLISEIVFVAIWRAYSLRKIGGITGDVLGASARLSETIIMLVFLVLNQYI
ncbi:MAG: adenosylcobinamide-GDP ribazoletransferase [Candidatus Methanofastidiosa archaeon]|nr:adenosylcobinamide-GDP ribazoletransferase [Candidatus Methanofastidiosa archaeon]